MPPKLPVGSARALLGSRPPPLPVRPPPLPSRRPPPLPVRPPPLPVRPPPLPSLRPITTAAKAQPAPAKPQSVADYARFITGTAPDKPFTAGSLLRGTFTPRYPGLDRPVGTSRNPLNKAVDRPADRARQLAAHGLRLGGTAVGVGSLGAAAHDLAYSLPRSEAYNVAAGDLQMRDQHAREFAENLGNRAVGEYYPALLGATMGLSDDPLSKLHGDVAREVAIPEMRHRLYEARQQSPVLFGAMDAMRSVTPAGLLATLGLRAAGSSREPNTREVVRDKARKYLPDIMADPEQLERSPFFKLYRESLPPHALSPYLARWVNEPDKPNFYAGAAGPPINTLRGLTQQLTQQAVPAAYQTVKKHGPTVAANMYTGASASDPWWQPRKIQATAMAPVLQAYMPSLSPELVDRVAGEASNLAGRLGADAADKVLEQVRVQGPVAFSKQYPGLFGNKLLTRRLANMLANQ